MYSFKKDKKLRNIIGDSINIYGVYAYGIHITLNSGKRMIINGIFEILNETGKTVCKEDAALNLETDYFFIGPLLNQEIVDVRPEISTLKIIFKNNCCLVVYDDPKYEVFSLDSYYV